MDRHPIIGEDAIDVEGEETWPYGRKGIGD